MALALAGRSGQFENPLQKLRLSPLGEFLLGKGSPSSLYSDLVTVRLSINIQFILIDFNKEGRKIKA